MSEETVNILGVLHDDPRLKGPEHTRGRAADSHGARKLGLVTR